MYLETLLEEMLDKEIEIELNIDKRAQYP